MVSTPRSHWGSCWSPQRLRHDALRIVESQCATNERHKEW